MVTASDKEQYVIQTVGLTKIFRDFWGHQRVIAVDNLDLAIRHREVYGLLGPNGSGKSTTIKMLLGLLFSTRGVAKVLGKPPGDVKTNQRIGYLPEESYLYPFLNARETLDFYGRLFSLSAPDRRQRIDSLLEMVGLGSVSRRPVGEYSKGMMRRIGLAQALINDPELLILDEPTSGLDPIGTRQIKDLIKELGRRGKTVLLCSHLLADVEDVCDRIGILYGGKLRCEGTMDELLTRREVTQIRSSRLSPGTVHQIESLIRLENPDSEVKVETPRDRLEDYFLRVVTEAQTAQVATSGAMIGAGVSDFLSDRSQEAEPQILIERLVSGKGPGETIDQRHSAAESGPGASDAPRVEEIETVRHEVLDALVDKTTAKVSGETESPAPTRPAALPEDFSPREIQLDKAGMDQSVIDGLLEPKKPLDDPKNRKNETSKPTQDPSRSAE
jgi:ABC-2 type transport system ATP-binding protein